MDSTEAIDEMVLLFTFWFPVRCRSCCIKLSC